MKPLPLAETYERELQFMPYRNSLKMVEDIVCADAPHKAIILDLMCGPGYLLMQIHQRRPDLRLRGVDNNPRYISHAKKKCGASFFTADVLSYSYAPSDIVLCTGALHHIPYEKQEQVVETISKATKPKGFAIISDCYIDDFSTEQERQLAAAKLGYEYLRATIRGAPAEVIAATIDILHNDVMGQEFKTSLEKRLPLFKKHFREVRTMKTWPNLQIGGYGDYVTILRK